MRKVVIEGKEITLTKEQEDIIYGDGMDEIYAYHKINRSDFDKQYEGIPDNIKALQQEFLIVACYNRDEKPDLSNTNQYKYFPWFEVRNGEQVLFGVDNYGSDTYVPAPALFLRKADCEEAVYKHLNIYKRSRSF